MHYKDAKTILSAKGGMNLYRGCTHGCIYCDSRSECYRMEHDFEDVEVKGNAPELLRAALRKKRRKCMIGAGSMSDPYNPLEQTLCLTRRCLEIIEREGFGATLITKSDLVLRDMDLLERINRTGTTVLVATHDREMVDNMRRRVIALDRGHLTRDQDRGVYGFDV